MRTDDPRELITRFRHVQAALSAGVAIRLGQWAGLGDWRSLSAESRTQAGILALAELDKVLEHLVALRHRLAAQLAPFTFPSDDQREGR
ncbi:hypothetical protein AB0F91_42580 [Amycolatopsis sp. NPDC023774]|uniref:hypothetical protein n=1 Tax=Amycolatopsis sp. NPDC023774 TaxID=3155015 RepID=UPI0033F09CB3